MHCNIVDLRRQRWSRSEAVPVFALSNQFYLLMYTYIVSKDQDVSEMNAVYYIYRYKIFAGGRVTNPHMTPRLIMRRNKIQKTYTSDFEIGRNESKNAEKRAI